MKKQCFPGPLVMSWRALAGGGAAAFPAAPSNGPAREEPGLADLQADGSPARGPIARRGFGLSPQLS